MVQRWSARSVQARPDTGGLWRSGCAGAIAAWRFVEPPEELPLTIESTPRHKAPRAFPAGHADCLLTRLQGGWKVARETKGSRTSAESSRSAESSGRSAGFSAYGGSGAGPERLVLGLALLLPLAVIVLALAQIPGTGFASPPNFIPD